MGSFNVACGLSHVSISPGDRAWILLLAPHRYQSKQADNSVTIGPEAYLVSNDGAQGLYEVQGIPILATYDDYGSWNLVEEPGKNECLAPLNAWLAKTQPAQPTVKDLVENLSSMGETREGYPASPVEGWSAMYIREDAWNKARAWSDTPEQYFDWLWPVPACLAALGFVPHARPVGDKRYNQAWTHPDLPANVVFASDGHFGHLCTVELSPDEQVWKLVQAHDSTLLTHLSTVFKTKSLSGQDLSAGMDAMRAAHPHTWWELADHAQKVVRYSARLREARAAVEAAPALTEENALSAEQMELNLLRMESTVLMMECASDRRLNFSVDRELNAMFMEHLGDPVGSPALLTLMAEWRTILIFMSAVSLTIMPTAIGPQCGEPRATHALGKLIMEISADILAQRAEEDIEDDEGDGA